MPHTPHTPGAAISHPLTPSNGPPSVSSIYNETNINANHSSPVQNQSPQNKSNMNNQNPVDTIPINRSSDSLANLSAVDLNTDLNFDPTAVIDGETNGDLSVSVNNHTFLWTFSISIVILFCSLRYFQLLSDSVVDPMELLSYLDPPNLNLNTPPSSGSSNNPNNDDILAALFD